MNLISVIVPCWNEEETIPIYYEHVSGDGYDRCGL